MVLCSHGSQGMNAYETANDDNISNIVELLKNISNQKGTRKSQNQLYRVPFGHIVYHVIRLLLLACRGRQDEFGELDESRDK